MFRKRGPDQIVVAVDFSRKLNPGETVVASNPRGSLGVAVLDGTGADVTAGLVDGPPWIASGTQVAFWLRAGTVGPYYTVLPVAPTSDGELLTAGVALEVLP